MLAVVICQFQNAENRRVLSLAIWNVHGSLTIPFGLEIAEPFLESRASKVSCAMNADDYQRAKAEALRIYSVRSRMDASCLANCGSGHAF